MIALILSLILSFVLSAVLIMIGREGSVLKETGYFMLCASCFILISVTLCSSFRLLWAYGL